MKVAHEVATPFLIRHSPLIDPSYMALAVYNAPVLRSSQVHERMESHAFLRLQKIVSLPLYRQHRERQSVGSPDSFLVMPRLNTNQAVNGEVDVTAGWGIFGTNAEGSVISRLQTLSPLEILGARHAEIYNPEDARVLPLGNGLVDVAYTAADKQTRLPYPAFLRLHINSNGQARVLDNSREVLDYLPAGKNIAPLTDTSQPGAVALYRKETEDHRFTFIRRNNQGRWVESRTIDLLPNGKEVQWVGKDGRFGLTGIEPITKLDTHGKQKKIKPGDEFLMIIHGFSYVDAKSGQKVNKDSGIPEYALGVMRCRQRADKTFDVLQISDTPIFAYHEAQEIDEYNPNKHVVYCTGYTVHEGKIYIPITIGDKRIDWYSGNVEDLWSLFPTGPDSSQRRILRLKSSSPSENLRQIAA